MEQVEIPRPASPPTEYAPGHRRAKTPDAAPSAPSYVLLTGATGFLGQYLLRELLLRDCAVAVLARPQRALSAAARVDQLLQRWPECRAAAEPSLVVLQGDVVAPDLGLDATTRAWVRRHCRTFLHNAASVNFAPAPRDHEPWTTNLVGTEHVVKFCESQGIADLHHVSTAYVCGTREGAILESELDCGQTFRNPYEASKFEAELLVQASARIAQKTVYRPSIITGDSRTGYTCTYHGMMWYLRLFDLLIPQQPRNANGRFQTDIVLPIDGDEPHDVVTVDWVAEVIADLLSHPGARDRVFHVTASQATTIREVVDYCCEYFHSEGVIYAGKQANRRATSEFSDLVFRMAQAYHGYEQAAPQFDRSNLLDLIPDARSPQIDRDAVIRFLEFGRQDRWGKRTKRSGRAAVQSAVQSASTAAAEIL